MREHVRNNANDSVPAVHARHTMNDVRCLYSMSPHERARLRYIEHYTLPLTLPNFQCSGSITATRVHITSTPITDIMYTACFCET